MIKYEISNFARSPIPPLGGLTQDGTRTRKLLSQSDVLTTELLAPIFLFVREAGFEPVTFRTSRRVKENHLHCQYAAVSQ